MSRWGIVAVAYTLIGALAIWLADSLGGYSAFTLQNPWIFFSSIAGAHLFSGLLGLTFGILVAFSTKYLVRRVRLVERLHADLRPLALGLSSHMLLVLSLTSSFGEELLFRGLLQPWLGLWPQALIFGFLHQTSGNSRWVWMVWATLMGLALGTTYQLTGSLVGSFIAHAVVNALDLAFLKSHDPDQKQRPLGGLLGQRN